MTPYPPLRHQPKPRQQVQAGGGYTLIELMVSIAILAVILGIAVPSFTDATLGSRLTSFANELAASTHQARAEAIKRNRRVELCVSANPDAASPTCASGNWAQGWIIRVVTGGEVLYRRSALPTGFRLKETSNASALVFQPTGLSSTSASFIACRATPSVGQQERVITLTASGRAYVETTHNGTCE